MEEGFIKGGNYILLPPLKKEGGGWILKMKSPCIPLWKKGEDEREVAKGGKQGDSGGN